MEKEKHHIRCEVVCFCEKYLLQLKEGNNKDWLLSAVGKHAADLWGYSPTSSSWAKNVKKIAGQITLWNLLVYSEVHGHIWGQLR